MSDTSNRRLAASIAAHTKWAQVDDRKAATQPARNAFWKGFERQVDPEGQLPPEERSRRAQSLMRAHFQRMALASAKARARNSADRKARELAAELRAAADELDAGSGAA